ncbi:MAG: XRE family transcriptional regulator [Marivivens sp.]|nr:XRE family transcriptional regulator [Marivivens sp.]
MLCRRIKALRLKRSLTQQEVAGQLGISQAAYSRLEKGEVEVSYMKLISLSELFAVPLLRLLDEV